MRKYLPEASTDTLTLEVHISVLGYTIYLCIMSRVPRPFPLITPIDLLTGSTPSLTRKPSTTSVDSKSGLLTHASTLPTVRPASLTSVYSYHPQYSVSTRTIPKRLFVVNPEVRSPSSYTPTATQREHQIRPGESYGAMGSPGRPPPRSRFSGSTIASVQSQNTPPPTIRSPVQSFVGALSRRISTRAVASQKHEQNKSPSRRPTISRPMLLDSNPFREPLSRHGTPETALSSRSFVTAPANVNLRQLPTYIPFSQAQAYGNYVGPFSYPTHPPGIPPQLQPGAGASAESGKRSALFVPADAMSMSMNMNSNVNGIPAHMLGPHIGYAGSPVTPSRVHTATPSSASIHSVVPSVHCIDEYGYPITRTGTTRSPPPAHICTASDPIWRPYSAGARMTGMYDNAELPNPYNRGAEIRRYGSVPHVRGAFGYGLGTPYGGVAYYTAGYTGHGARVHEHGIARGLAAANDPSWREMVMRAAASQ